MSIWFAGLDRSADHKTAKNLERFAAPQNQLIMTLIEKLRKTMGDTPALNEMYAMPTAADLGLCERRPFRPSDIELVTIRNMILNNTDGVARLLHNLHAHKLHAVGIIIREMKMRDDVRQKWDTALRLENGKRAKLQSRIDAIKAGEIA